MTIYNYRVTVSMYENGSYRLFTHDEIVEDVEPSADGWFARISEWTAYTYYKEPRYFNKDSVRYVEWASETSIEDFRQKLTDILYLCILEEWEQASVTYGKMLQLLK